MACTWHQLFLRIFLSLVLGPGLLAQVLIPSASQWLVRKGTAEASSPTNAWRLPDSAPAGFGAALAPFYYDTDGGYTGATALADMRGVYTSVFLRKTVQVVDAGSVGALRVRFLCDDGFVLWINGVQVASHNHTGVNVAYNATANASASEPPAWTTLTLRTPGYLRDGANLVAVQAFNQSRTSSDFLFDLELTALRSDGTVPRITRIDPPPGTVGNLTSVTVTFSEPVTGVGFSDLLVDGRPAVGMEGGANEYRFLLPELAAGEHRITWDPGAGIEDLSDPPNRFRQDAPEASWNYLLRDAVPPTIARRHPVAGARIRSLSRVELHFTEPVVGVEAADLLRDGVTAQRVSGTGAGPYVFEYPPAPAGLVRFAWASGSGIRDLAEPPNPFAGESWEILVDPALPLPRMRINEVVAIPSPTTGFVDEDGDASDWIELHNAGTTTVDLAGWALSDDPDEPGKWPFDNRNIGPGGYLVVWASAKDRTQGTRPHANFRLAADGEFLGLYDNGSPRTLISSIGREYPPQRVGTSYGLDGGGVLRYFSQPTPGSANSGMTLQGHLEPVTFSSQRGVHTQQFNLSLAHPDPDAVIRFTQDGSLPSPSRGDIYRGSIPIQASTVIRAAAYRDGWIPSPVTTHTFVLPDSVLRQGNAPPGLPPTWIDAQSRSWTADYEMDPEVVGAPGGEARVRSALLSLPSISIVADPEDLFSNVNGIYPKSQQRGPAWERPASFEILEPTTGRQVQADAGVQMQGNSVRDPVKTGKHAFRIVFKDDYGPRKLEWRVFEDSPVEAFDTLTLRADFNNSWMHWDPAQRPRGQRIRDAWMKDSQRAMGGLSSHSRFFHLYLNGLYWGIYDATERPDASFGAAYLGGAKSNYDVVNEGALVDGDMVAYRELTGIADAGSQSGYGRIAQLLDVPAYIDYVLLHFYTGHGDWFTDKNWYAIRQRVPAGGFRYNAWDGELMLNGVQDDVVTRSDQPSNLHPRLRLNPQYRLDFADRVQKHLFNDGALTPAASIARYRRRLAEIEPAIHAEAARWGDYRRDVHPYSTPPYELYGVESHFNRERDRLLTNYFPARTAVLLTQLRNADLYPAIEAPTLGHRGGRVSPGLGLVLSAPVGEVRYTVDGSDPRVRWTGAVSASARTAGSTPILIDQSLRIRARTLSGGVWSALVEAEFTVTSELQPIRFTELHPNPPGGELYEYVELQNMGSRAVDLGGHSLDGVRFIFPVGFIVPAGGVVLLASDRSPASFANRHPGVHVDGWFGGALSNNGERLRLLDPTGRVLASIAYGPGWPPAGSQALERIPGTAPGTGPAAWQQGPGSPGEPALNPPVSVVRLSEVFAREAPLPDWIELHNHGPEPVVLAGWSLADRSSTNSYVLPAGTVLAPGAYLRIWCGAVPGPGELATPFGLAASGDSVRLLDGAGTWMDGVDFGQQADALSLARTEPDLAWLPSEPTPGAANRPIPVASFQSLRWNEWMANPPPGEDDWVELYNADPTRPALLDGLFVETSRGKAPLPLGTVVSPRGHIRIRLGDGTDELGLPLPAAGGFLRLLHAEQLGLDELSYASQDEGFTEGRIPDGAPATRVLTWPTPAAPNIEGEPRQPLLHAPRLTDGEWILEVEGTPGVRHVLEASPDLGSWVEVDAQRPGRSRAEWRIKEPGAQFRFFRVRLQR